MGQLMDAPCVAPSRVTQKDFCCFSGVIAYHHIVLTMSFKLVSFFTYIGLGRTDGRMPGDQRPTHSATIRYTEQNNVYLFYCETEIGDQH